MKLRSLNFPSPANRRALFLVMVVGALLASWPAVRAQAPAARPEPKFTGGRPDQAEGARVLDEFRRAGIAGTYWLAFELRVMPRKGAERTINGALFGTRAENGPLTRVSVRGESGEERWLLRNGPNAATWHWRRGGEPAGRELSAEEVFTPIAGTDLTIFDLQMPFLYWPDFVYEGIARVRSRPAHRVLLYPPADLAAARPELAGVRVYLDTQFQALVQAEMLDAKGEVTKTITVLDLKKTTDQWIVKSIDVRNHRTRDKTRFMVDAAAFGLDLPPATFTPGALGTDDPRIPAGKLEHF